MLTTQELEIIKAGLENAMTAIWNNRTMQNQDEQLTILLSFNSMLDKIVNMIIESSD